jgi:hypothetical protein
MIFRYDADLQERDFGLVPRARSPPFLHELASFCANRLNLLATSLLTSALRHSRRSKTEPSFAEAHIRGCLKSLTNPRAVKKQLTAKSPKGDRDRPCRQASFIAPNPTPRR